MVLGMSLLKTREHKPEGEHFLDRHPIITHSKNGIGSQTSMRQLLHLHAIQSNPTVQHEGRNKTISA